MRNVALITGITGQDGSYLSELLLEKGYEVHGIIRRSSSFNTWRIQHLLDEGKIFTHYGDVTDSSNLNRLLKEINPTEVYNLAAQSHVGISFQVPESTADATALGALRLLDALRDSNIDARFYQASTSELFGGIKSSAPQNENTPFMPRSPYAAAKLYAYWVVVNYREAYGLHATNGVLFNHESPRRGENFVTRKIAKSVASIERGESELIRLGNLDAVRDWGYAKDYVESMWKMLRQNHPDDYVVATGEAHTVREFVEKSFAYVGTQIEWEGLGVEEIGRDAKTGKIRVCVDPQYFRPTEVDYLVGDPSKAKKVLDWSPTMTFNSLVNLMVNSELAR